MERNSTEAARRKQPPLLIFGPRAESLQANNSQMHNMHMSYVAQHAVPLWDTTSLSEGRDEQL